MIDIAALLDIFYRSRDLVALPNNDFAWSSWPDQEAALAEIDDIIGQLQRGEIPDQMQMVGMFGPTGRMQEVSMSSGWGNRFLQLASEFDAAMDDAD